MQQMMQFIQNMPLISYNILVMPDGKGENYISMISVWIEKLLEKFPEKGRLFSGMIFCRVAVFEK